MHRTAITATRLKNWVKSGRGFGFFSTYKPWIQVSRQDHSSHGYSHQTPNPFTGRTHHLLSNLEKSVFRMVFAHPFVTDCREQFPIWPEEHTSPLISLKFHLGEACSSDGNDSVAGSVAIARKLNIPHAKYVGLNQPYVHTTDQLLTIQLPKKPVRLVAIAIKTVAELKGFKKDAKSSSRLIHAKKRRSVFQKLRLERAYWQEQGVPWLLITDRQINTTVVRNLEFGYSAWQQRVPFSVEWEYLKKLRQMRRCDANSTCKEYLSGFAIQESISPVDAVRIFKLGLICGQLSIDLTKPIGLAHPVPWGPKPNSTALPSWSLLHKAWGSL